MTDKCRCRIIAVSGWWSIFIPKILHLDARSKLADSSKICRNIWQKNARIIGISADDVDSHAEFCDAEGLKFPLLADTDGKASKAYGSWMNFISARHSFIIDPDGILRDTFVKVNPAMHSKEVFDRLLELQANG